MKIKYYKVCIENHNEGVPAMACFYVKGTSKLMGLFDAIMSYPQNFDNETALGIEVVDHWEKEEEDE